MHGLKSKFDTEMVGSGWCYQLCKNVFWNPKLVCELVAGEDLIFISSIRLHELATALG